MAQAASDLSGHGLFQDLSQDSAKYFAFLFRSGDPQLSGCKFYIPIILLMLFSFNEAKITTRWSSFSLRWYQELFENDAIIDAALISLRIAVISATVATIVGVLRESRWSVSENSKERLFFPD